MNKGKQLTPNFFEYEFLCHCGCGYGAGLIDLDFVAGLQALRNMINVGRSPYYELGITILSGCRCPKHNNSVGGAYDSRHLKCDAADIAVRGLTSLQICLLAEEIPVLGGIGRYPDEGMAHLDGRKYKQTRTRWVKDNGIYMTVPEWIRSKV